MAAGHAHAWRYPLGRVYFEAELVIQRTNAQHALVAQLQLNAITTAFAGEAGAESFQKITETLTGGG